MTMHTASTSAAKWSVTFELPGMQTCTVLVSATGRKDAIDRAVNKSLSASWAGQALIASVEVL